MEDILKEVRADLRRSATTKAREVGRTFFKGEVKLYGVKAARLRVIARDRFREISTLPKGDLFALCEGLWRSGYVEEAMIACFWSHAVRKQYTPGVFRVFERWVRLYVTNWATCDTLCNHTVGTALEMYPALLPRLKVWARSRNRWMRRGAAVSLILPARKGRFLEEILAIADILLEDRDDMVQKGYGWMLKEASKPHQQGVFDYVFSRKDIMPRTALRYALEHMPTALRTRAMVREVVKNSCRASRSRGASM